MKNLVKRILRKVRFTRDLLDDRDLMQRYDRIMLQEFKPKLYSSIEELRIGEIEINNNCNLNCIMCNTVLSARPHKNMKLDLFEQALQHTCAIGQRVIALHTIGEPLLNPNLDKYLYLIKQYGLQVFLSTNCHLLKKKWDVLIKYADIIMELRFSIDGATKETYEKIRRPGKFDQLIENLEYFRAATVSKKYFNRVSINSIVSHDVKHELAYHILFYSKYVEPWNIQLNLVSGLSPDNTYFLNESILKKHIVPWHPCDQLFSSTVHILNDGSMTACCRDYNGDLVYGDIKTKSLDVLINCEKVLEFRKQQLENRIHKSSLCASCFRTDPRVSELFNLFASELIRRFWERWDVKAMQARFDDFFSLFNIEIPNRYRFLSLLKR